MNLKRIKEINDMLAAATRDCKIPVRFVGLDIIPDAEDLTAMMLGEAASKLKPQQQFVDGVVWSRPMSQTEMRVRLNNLSARKFKTFTKLHPLRPAGNRQQWQIRVDGMDQRARKQIEAP